MTRPFCTHRARLFGALLLAFLTLPGQLAAQERIYFSAVDNVRDALVARINAETVRIDMSAWYLTDRNVSRALVNRFLAGVPVRLIGDRGSIFEIDVRTKTEFYWLANQGLPIRLRYNPRSFPEIAHWKATIFVGQGIVAFGSANYTPFELVAASSTNYKDETVLFTDDPQLVEAFKTKFDRFWNDQTVEPESRISGPPYFRNWDAACAAESECSDYRTLYPNPAPMVIDTRRLEGDAPMPPDMVWGQGPSFNNRLVQEIDAEPNRVDFVIYRLTVDNITEALLAKHRSGVPVRIIIEPNEYLNRKWPEFWLTHANIDKLWAAGVQIKKRRHDGLTHMKMLVTSRYATNASSNLAANWQRDHNYFVPAATKPAIHAAMANRFQFMWTDTTGFENFRPERPDAAVLVSPAHSSTGVATTASLVWQAAPFATSYDVYMGTAPGALTRAGNVPARLVQNPPSTYSFTTPLQGGTTYYWQIVSRTNATPVDSSIVNQSVVRNFTTSGTPSQPPPSTLPAPWQSQDVGSVGRAGSASSSSGQFTVVGAGADIWGTADSFRFVYQTLSGDGTVVARVTSLQNTHTYAKAGVMLRESLSANSPHVLADLRPGGGFEFLKRSVAGGTTSNLASGTQGIPGWVRLARSGTVVAASVSANGSTWTSIGSTTVTMGSTLYAGLAVTSHNTSVTTTAVFDNVSVQTGGTAPQPPGQPGTPSPANGASSVSISPTLTWSAAGAASYNIRFGTANPPPSASTGLTSASYAPGTLTSGTRYYWQVIAINSVGQTTGPVWSFTTGTAAATLPAPWDHRDIGSVGVAGSATHSNGQFTVRGAGADIWGTVDGFHFVYQPLSGDSQIVARMVSMQNTHTYAKAGVMIRAGLTANAAHAMLDVRPNGSVEFMRRASGSGSTEYLGGATQSAPAWLRLARTGSTITSFVSSDGATWRPVGSTTLSLGSTAYIGFLVCSHTTSALNTAVFDNVSVSATTAGGPPPAASAPSPANNATGASTSVSLTWSGSASSYDLRLGTTNPPPQVATGLTQRSYSPGALSEGTTYYWQVVSHNGSGTTDGPSWSFTTGTGTQQPGIADVVIYAGDLPASALHGSWSTATDSASPGGVALVTTDAGFAAANSPLANPAHYVDVSFNAEAGTPYRIWLRLRALNDSKYNDAVWVQFSDALVNGGAAYRIGTTSGLLVNLATDAGAASLSGWGWQNGAYWLSQATAVTFPTSGPRTLRIQVREDGVHLDQIVLSATTYLNTAPGPPTDDSTIVSR